MSMELAIVGTGLVSPVGLSPEEHAFFLRAGARSTTAGAFVGADGEPIRVAHCPWLGARMPVSERLTWMASAALDYARRALGEDRAPVILCTSPPREGLSDDDVAAVADALTIGREPAPSRASGPAGFFAALREAGERLSSGAARAVAIVAVDSAVHPRALEAIRGTLESPWRRRGPHPAEAAAAVVVMKAGEARARALDVLGTVAFAGVAASSSNDDNDEIVDGAAMTSLLRSAAPSGPIGRVFGQHNVDSLRRLEWGYAAARNSTSLRPDAWMECVEEDIGAVGAAAGAVHLVYALAVDRHGTVSRGEGDPFVAWAISRDGLRGLCMMQGGRRE